MRTTSRARVVREGWTGRRRHYRCRRCGQDFVHDGQQLPEAERICLSCIPTAPATEPPRCPVCNQEMVYVRTTRDNQDGWMCYQDNRIKELPRPKEER